MSQRELFQLGDTILKVTSVPVGWIARRVATLSADLVDGLGIPYDPDICSMARALRLSVDPWGKPDLVRV